MTSEFVKGAMQIDQVPRDNLPFVLLVGRSNCGKSSLLNLLTARKKLARVSKTPGRTREANFFRVDEEYFIVDLPGYSFAKGVKATVQEEWGRMIPELFKDRRSALVLLLADIRRSCEEEEHQVAALAESAAVPLRVVLTKQDKIGRSGLREVISHWKSELSLSVEPIMTSSHDRKHSGLGELRSAVGSVLAARKG